MKTNANTNNTDNTVNTQAFTKVIRLGSLGRSNNWIKPVFCKITYEKSTNEKKGMVLSITGVIAPNAKGNAFEAGQIIVNLEDNFKDYGFIINPVFTMEDVEKFMNYWDKWHNNDLHAGTPKQEEALKEYFLTQPSISSSYYETACTYLESIGLLTDDGYKYGSAWLFIEVPEDVISFLRGLPDTDITPIWI